MALALLEKKTQDRPDPKKVEQGSPFFRTSAVYHTIVMTKDKTGAAMITFRSYR